MRRAALRRWRFGPGCRRRSAARPRVCPSLPSRSPRPGKCVEDTPYMLRNHMELLKHHRDRTVHEGVRTTQYSLANCVACHASKETGRVTGSKDAFCEGCHQYAAVKLDCFECHADRPEVRCSRNRTGHGVGDHAMSAAGPMRGCGLPEGGAAAPAADTGAVNSKVDRGRRQVLAWGAASPGSRWRRASRCSNSRKGEPPPSVHRIRSAGECWSTSTAAQRIATPA